MIYKTISRMELNIPIPGGEQVRLRAYLRPEQGFVADDGARWAVIVCPGGGYGLVAPGEGEPVALAFLAAGKRTCGKSWTTLWTPYTLQTQGCIMA